MNLDELRSVQSKERQKDSLQNLRPSFYQEVGEYIADLEDERDRVAEQAEDPFSSPEVSRLTDEIETAKDVVEAIYERRMGKLVKQASLAAAGMPADDEGLTAEEADLFDDLVDRIESNKSRVLDVLEGVETEQTGGTAAGADDTAAGRGREPGAEPGRADPTADSDPGVGSDPGAAPEPDVAEPASRSGDDAPPAPPQEPPDAVESAEADASDSSGVSPADVMGGEPSSLDDGGSGAGSTPTEPPEPEPEPTPDRAPDVDSSEPSDSAAAADGSTAADARSSIPTDDVDRTTVRITRDVGSILGIDDREYTLSTDDIVTLPEQNADPLVEQDAAERLE